MTDLGEDPCEPTQIIDPSAVADETQIICYDAETIPQPAMDIDKSDVQIETRAEEVSMATEENSVLLDEKEIFSRSILARKELYVSLL